MRSIFQMPSDNMPPSQRRGGITLDEEGFYE